MQGQVCGRGRWAGAASDPVCPPVPSVSIPDLVWETELLACGGATAGAGCDSGALCVPDAELVCVAREGSHECPPAYPDARELFLGAADNRECTECSCTAGDAVTCETTLNLYSGADCTGLLQTLDVPGTGFSDPVSTDGLGSAAFLDPTVTTTCTPAGGEPLGAPVEEDPYTICCR